MTPISFRHCSYDDASGFHNSLNLFQVNTWQMSRGKFHGNLLEIVSELVQIDLHSHNRLCKLEGTPTSSWAFGIPPRPLCLLFAQKYLLDEQYILIAPPHSEFQMLQKSPYSLYVIYFSDHFLNYLCEHYHLPEPQQFLGSSYPAASAVQCSRYLLTSLQKTINQLYQNILNFYSQNSTSPLLPYILNNYRHILEVEIPKKLLFTLAEAQEIKPKKCLFKRLNVFKQAEEFMRVYAQAEISLGDICQEIGVSQRNLEYIFQDFYGMSPKTYLKQIRLNQLRHALRNTDPKKAKIYEIAQEWGFWHSGQLAADYYQLFGELPSATLRS